MPAQTQATLHLFRHAETAWREVARPWLADNDGGPRRSHVLVPTRGQAHGLKQRCLMEGVPLLGVEFLSPGLARKKWLAQLELAGRPAPAWGAAPAGEAAPRPAIGRELLLLGLRVIIGRRLQPLSRDSLERGLLKSLQSDPERALDDFDELLRCGFGAREFPLEVTREVFGELAFWVEALGYELAPLQGAGAGTGGAAGAAAPLLPGHPRMPGRLLIHGFSAESRGEFSVALAFARCFGEVVVTLPEPEFRGRKALDEAWIELWEKNLSASAVPLDEPEPPASCEAVAEVWGAGGGDAAARPAPSQSRVLAGVTRADEMALVADEIAALLAGGAENIGVIFPRADAAHARLAGLLAERGIAFADMIGMTGAVSLETRAQRALLRFHERGGRLEEFLELWALLRATGFVTQPPGAARGVCESLFQERHAHELAACRGLLAAGAGGGRAEWREVARVADLLLPVWPETLTAADALERFGAACAALELGGDAGAGEDAWGALRVFAEREKNPLPASALIPAMVSFLPEKSPAADAPGRGCFARVTLATRRRAEGLAWSHLVLAESNAGVWPEHREAGCWLPDETRARLAARAPAGRPAMHTSDDAAWLEKRGCAALARNTARAVVFSAALFDEENPELRLGPNSWVERLRWHELAAAPGGRQPSHEEIFDRLATTAAPELPQQQQIPNPKSQIPKKFQISEKSQIPKDSAENDAGSGAGSGAENDGAASQDCNLMGYNPAAAVAATDAGEVPDVAPPSGGLTGGQMNLPVKSGESSPHSKNTADSAASRECNLMGYTPAATAAAWQAAGRAASIGPISPIGPIRPISAAAAGREAGQAAWREVWRRRRDAAYPFDEYFFAFDPAAIRVDSLAARQIEAAVKDPAGLWFGEVLRAERVAWEPFTRNLRIALGSLTHRVIAAALRGTEETGGFGRRPGEDDARRRARGMLAEQRALWPANDYWDSFHAELARNCDSLLGKVFALDAGPFVATETWVPDGTRIASGADGFPLTVRGRMDLVLLDRPEWRGARVDIVDFKTGGDEKLTAAKMAAAGASLQLGVYLAAARALGAADGRVWMLKPGADAPSAVAMGELPEALSGLGRLARHLRAGVVGALTPDRNAYSFAGYAWPAACAPVPFATLKAKFAATFGDGGALESEAADG